MNRPTDTANSETTGFFRCPVQTDQGKAIVRVGRRKVRATVQETSIDGYTVLVDPKHASKLKVGRPWTLDYDDAQFEVHPQWFFNSPDGHVQMGLRRLRDVTTPEPIGSSWWPRLGSSHSELAGSSAAAYGGFVLVLFSIMALPGLGEKLGTSARIQSAFRWVLTGLDETVSQWL